VASDNRDPAAKVPPNVQDRNTCKHIKSYLATLLNRGSTDIGTAANCLVFVLPLEWMNLGGG
jgi:hypothetical protein